VLPGDARNAPKGPRASHRGGTRDWIAEEEGDHLMTVITSARIRALSIISITIVVVLLLLSSAVQATGQVSETAEYRVKPGDTLWQIAKTYGPQDTDVRRIVAAIERLNQIDGGYLQAGQVIEIPVISS